MKAKKFYLIMIPLIVAVVVLMYALTGFISQNFDKRRSKMPDCNEQGYRIESLCDCGASDEFFTE